MNQRKTVTTLAICIAIAAAIAATTGIFSNQGPGPYQYSSIHGESVTLYGRGIYKHMSAEVAIQGIAQDYVTLFMAVPLLLLSLYWVRKESLKGRFLLAGTLGYFFVTYLFYLTMGSYNQLFLLYAFLLGTSFFALTLTLLSFDISRLPEQFTESTPVKFTGSFLIFSAFSITMLWLSVVVPPLLDGSIYPTSLEHYTTLIVQGLDLGLLLPLAFVSGILLLRKRPWGYLLVPVYFVFLSILMTALTAKIIAMGLSGYNIIPVVFIIPTFAATSVWCTLLLLNNTTTAIRTSQIKQLHMTQPA
ncbi:hypothetical protein [Telluribacter sp. SYSU D00476]|uniref:hypothetical protein n=1 Tax=Telluribacter sp. SYSU D00476 TaxID=2811430 RepID=UPI001FF3247C|nr:hypothetical protein [Telluribacter sp. SYSU D00476]